MIKPAPILYALLAAILAVFTTTCSFPDFVQDGSGTNQTPVAIFFGIADYPPLGTSGGDLSLTVTDATAMRDNFASLGWETWLFTNADCNQNTLGTLASSIAAASQEGRRVLFYYSGHGSTSFSKDSTSMVWWDSSKSTRDYIGPRELAQILKPLFDAKARTCLILDSCYSGGFVFDATMVDTLPWNYSDSASWLQNSGTPEDLRAFVEWFGNAAGADSDTPSSQAFDPSRVWAMSAAGWNEVSWESSGYTDSSGSAHGIFTWTLLKGCQKDPRGYLAADSNKDGYTSLRELYAHSCSLMHASWNSELAGYGAYDDYLYLPHLSGNYTDIMLFTR